MTVLIITLGINVITEPNIATTAKKTVVTINTIIDNKPRKSFVTIIQIIESGVSEKINPGNLNVNPPQVKISFTTLPHKNWLTKVKDTTAPIHIITIK